MGPGQLPYPSSVSLMMSQISMLRAQSSLRRDPSVALSAKQKPRQGSEQPWHSQAAVKLSQDPRAQPGSPWLPLQRAGRQIHLQIPGHQVLPTRCHHGRALSWDGGCPTSPMPPTLLTCEYTLCGVCCPAHKGKGLSMTSAPQPRKRGLICFVTSRPQTMSSALSH